MTLPFTDELPLAGAFRDWLATLPEDGNVGVAGQGDACPLACYLARLGVADPYVSTNLLHMNGYQRTPSEWMVAFTHHIDKLPPEEVPVAAALKIIDSVIAGTLRREL